MQIIELKQLNFGIPRVVAIKLIYNFVIIYYYYYHHYYLYLFI
jgi:hypothetical protein